MRYTRAQIIRGSLGLGQVEVAKKIAISRPYLSQIETYKVPMTDEIKSKLTKLYNCNVSDLLPV